MPENLQTQQWPQDWKRSVFILIPKKDNAKECSNDCTIAVISHTSKIMLKILQARLLQYMNRDLPDVQAGFRKGSGITANICWIIGKTREFQKNIYLLYWLCQSLWLCGSRYTVENSERDGNTRPPDLHPEKSVCRSRSNSSNWTWNKQQTGSTSGKEYVKAVYCHPAYLTYMQSTSWEMLNWMKH